MKISIITPFYNGNEYLDKYLKMISSNHEHLWGDDLEVILVNDSPWCTPKLSSGLLLDSDEARERFPWLRLITNPENQGIHVTRITGIKASKGDYILMLDQDDLLEDYALKQFLDKAKEKSEGGDPADIIIANARLHQANSSLIWFRNDYHKAKVWDLNTYITVGTQIISPGQCLIRKSAIPNFWMTHICYKNGADDYFLWLLMMAEGAKYTYLDEAIYNHVYTAKNLSADTRVTDESSFEFIDYLYECEYFKNEDANLLKRMLKYKAVFRASGKFGKIKESLKNFDLFKENIRFKKKTATPYGFNR